MRKLAILLRINQKKSVYLWRFFIAYGRPHAKTTYKVQLFTKKIVLDYVEQQAMFLFFRIFNLQKDLGLRMHIIYLQCYSTGLDLKTHLQNH